VRLVLSEMAVEHPRRYSDVEFGVPYPGASGQRCDLLLGGRVESLWAIEVKMLRFFGDNGKLNDNILMHILSPYPEHRSALTDCEKLVSSECRADKAVLIFGYDYPGWPMDPAIDSFELLAGQRVPLGERMTAGYTGLIHPIHREGRVFAWQLSASA
jgi:hypothetical protein